VRAPAPVLVTTLAQPRTPNRTAAAALDLTAADSDISSPIVGTSVSDTVQRLVDRFDQNRDAYLSGSYNETQLVEDADGRQLAADGPRQER